MESVDKTLSTFQMLLRQQKEEFQKIFPHLNNIRVPAEETVQTVINPDGTVTHIKTTRSQQAMSFRHMRSTVNGVTTSSSLRAVVEYLGPNGKCQVKLEMVDDNAIESESEDDDDTVSMMSDSSDVSDISGAVVPIDSFAARLPTKKQKQAFCAAKELVDSERRYVLKLRLLDEIFRNKLIEANAQSTFLSTDKMSKLFSNLSSLHAFHRDHFLPQLQSRIDNWQQQQKMSDVVCQLAPFLKMYSEYTNNYNRAMKVFADLQKKSRKFGAVVAATECLPECDNLPLASHIICPVQRVMRYHLLLQEYFKNLEPGHHDKEDTEKAVQLVKTAASHANEMMRKLDKYKHVIEVQEMLGSQISDLLSPSRELVKQGRMTKISSRNNELQSRYLFLFNDMLLVCAERKVPLSKYKLRSLFEADAMQVLEGDNLEMENTFSVRSRNKFIELCASTVHEKNEWMDALWFVIRDFRDRMQSFIRPEKDISDVNVKKSTKSSPKSCSFCTSVFNTFKREYICRSCGVIVCRKCCSNKVVLSEGKKEARVCEKCYAKLKNDNFKPYTAFSRKSVFEVSPDENCLWRGYLDIKSLKKPWTRKYFVVHMDYVLYSFNSEKDTYASTSAPLPGVKICLPEAKYDWAFGKEPNVFEMEQRRRVYFLRCQSREEMAKWMAVLDLASKAELPIINAS
ncbi:unnamed protein product [Soboliphyme baturini]|uniref:FYVE, RhoGEF and PH domain-containing protein 4 n=1 Tax=Soboliphyme baturini TaxID=241478 RepID=A0A183IYT4_9BILA|nr:unnamed protein product [Soboliphyme baturini]